MIDHEKGIQPRQVPEWVNLVTPENDSRKNVTEAHPSRSVMTDFRNITPFQIQSSASLEDVNNKMIACGVRLLFVNDLLGNLAGLITATDVLGEKPLMFINNNGGMHSEITAQDIMTPLDKLEAIPFSQVLRATVADIVGALRDCRRHHMLILENRDGCDFIRGIFSATQVSRQLGIEIIANQRAEGFAELKEALG